MQLEHTTIAGRYAVHEALGSGGMATVYRATDDVLGRDVAVKVLRPGAADDEALVARFRREARAAAGLGHPGIVAIFDTGSDGDLHYIVMELVPGRTLGEVLRAEGPLEPERAAEIGGAVAGALAFAHGKGIVHRDVKPANVMLTPHDDVKVMDFGIARAMAMGDTLTRASNVLGTAAYLSPEQAEGERVDARTDVYSLGAVLYEMLAGRPPFTGDSPIVVATKHVRETPVQPGEVNPGVPPKLQAVTMRALEKRPEDRFQTAAEMGAALSASGGHPAAATTNVLDPTPTAVLPAARPRRRRRGLVVAIVAGLVALGVILAAALAGNSPAHFAAGRHPSTPPASPSNSPPPSPSPSVATFASTVGSIRQLLAAGVSAGAIDSHAADDVNHQLDDLLKAATDGKQEDIAHKVEDLQNKISDDVDHGQIQEPYATQLKDAVQALLTSVGGGGGEGD